MLKTFSLIALMFMALALTGLAIRGVLFSSHPLAIVLHWLFCIVYSKNHRCKVVESAIGKLTVHYVR